MILPIVIAGGAGERLWPLSRNSIPKQFLKIHSEFSFFQDVLSRIGYLNFNSSLVVCNEEHRFICAEQLRQSNFISKILLEPFNRNTSPSLAISSFYALIEHDDPLLLVLPSDHIVLNVSLFQKAIFEASKLAEKDLLVTFGILPTHAETGYGYIRRGAEVAASTAFEVGAFVEKPALAKAEEYVASGEYYWNSGMFMFKASRYLEELNKYRPDIYAACKQAVAELTPDLDFIRINAEAFAACPAESIDYAIMEKTDSAVVVPLDAGWNDIGSFSALWQVGEKDEQQNVIKGDVIHYQSQGNYIHSDDKLIATVGVQDLVIVNTKDAVLVAQKKHTQDVKHIVEELKAAGRPEVSQHRQLHRPWGSSELIDAGDRYQVKRLTVKPGAKLSVQMHHHRAEHWIVVSGTAKVTIDGNEQYLAENQSVYIPITAVHALENPGKVPLELIEVQSGSYLGEDDIVRFADRYGRA